MILTRVKKDGRTVRMLSRKTNELIVTETRAPKPFRAVPRQVGLRIASLEQSKKFLVRYQDVVNLTVTATRCWKCGVPIVAYQPALRKVEGSRNKQDAELTIVKLNGQDVVLGAMLPYNHYREGLFTYYLTKERRLARFSFLHCADCHIAAEHGEDLLACLLGTPDWKRDLMKPFLAVSSDDEWAQSMFRWSGIELVGLDGPSVGPKELMEQSAKKGKP